MKANKLIACHECDTIIDAPPTEHNHSLYCPRCNCKQFTVYKRPLDYCIAFASSALIMLMLANSFAFLSFESQGQSRTITLVQAALDMYQLGFVLLAVLIYGFIIFLPMVYLVCLLLLTLPLKLSYKPVNPVLLGRIMSYFLPWIMGEVFIIGVLVALIKVLELADVVLGISFWAYIGFTFFFTLAANIADQHQLWEWVDDARA